MGIQKKSGYIAFDVTAFFRGRYWIRTSDPLLVRQML